MRVPGETMHRSTQASRESGQVKGVVKPISPKMLGMSDAPWDRKKAPGDRIVRRSAIGKVQRGKKVASHRGFEPLLPP